MSNEMPGTQCSVQIDYTNVGEDKKLPFVIELDLENSVLAPVHGENQRFCYQITGVGEDIPLYSSLNYFILDLIGDIPEDHITNFSVTIDGIEQDISYGAGGNINLLFKNNPDPNIGHSGLRFDFGLNKATGLMTVSFELTQVYPLGANPIYLYGEGFSASGLTICGPVCHNKGICPGVIYQKASICVPVQVTFCAKAGSTKTTRKGTPIITKDCSSCHGVPNGNCQFTINQKLRIAVPVEIGTHSIIGNPSVVSLKSSTSSPLVTEEFDPLSNKENSNMEPDETNESIEGYAFRNSNRNDASNIKSLFNPHFRRRF